MRTRIGKVPDSLISLSLLLIFLILIALSVAGRAQANLHPEARAAGCFDGLSTSPVVRNDRSSQDAATRRTG